jgi:ABC-2 type transport system ATP-binding protein
MTTMLRPVPVAPACAPAVEAIGLTKSYGDRRALDTLDLRVERGEIFGLLGPNGAGKTTTIKLLTGQMQSDGGSIHIDGVDLAADPLGAKRRLGLVPDSPTVFEQLTAWEYVSFLARLYDVPPAVVERRAQQLFDLLELRTHADELLGRFSLGMRKKTQLAATLIPSPTLLILDEPLSGLDPETVALVKRLLRRFADGGRAVLVATHNLDFAEGICDRLCLLRGGQVVGAGTAAVIRAQARARSLEAAFLTLIGSETREDIVDAVVAGL